VVVQRRPGTPILDATLIATRPGGQASSAFLPAADLEPDPAPGPLPERRGRHRSGTVVGSSIPAGVGVATATGDSVTAHAFANDQVTADARADAGAVDVGGADVSRVSPVRPTPGAPTPGESTPPTT